MLLQHCVREITLSTRLAMFLFVCLFFFVLFCFLSFFEFRKVDFEVRRSQPHDRLEGFED